MNNGLEGVVAADTVLSHADGESGAVWVRGYTIEKLAADLGYEGAVALMWDGFAGQSFTRTSMQQALGAARAIYGMQFNPQSTLKALCYFGEGNLRRLPQPVKDRLSKSSLIRNTKHGQKIQERPFVRAFVGVTIGGNTSGPEH